MWATTDLRDDEGFEEGESPDEVRAYRAMAMSERMHTMLISNSSAVA
jgi:hypothetical protein